MIGYYIHHEGYGHLSRAISICSRLEQPAVALTSLPVPEPHPFAAVITLPRDDAGPIVEPTAHGALHWAPLNHDSYTRRMAKLAAWAADARPHACVIDVSVEVAVLFRLLGIPIVVMALPGNRFDQPHQLVHHLADHIVASWPRQCDAPLWLDAHAHKTSYVGGISRFDGRPRPAPDRPSKCETQLRTRVLMFSGAGGTRLDDAGDRAGFCPSVDWSVVGGSGRSWTVDPWPHLCSADIVVSHAGQGCIADIAAAKRPAVIIAQPRPFGEQEATAAMLSRHRLAVTVDSWPPPDEWQHLLRRATSLDPDRWDAWQVKGAAARAAGAIESVANRSRIREVAQ